MKYRVRPDYTCTAFRITEIRGRWENGNIALTLENGEQVEALKDMTARMQPKIGDYWVIAEDGYNYLNPKATFEAKHIPALEADDPAVWPRGDAPRVDLKKRADTGKVIVFDADKPLQGQMTMTPEQEAEYAMKEAARSVLPANPPVIKTQGAPRSQATGGRKSSNSKRKEDA